MRRTLALVIMVVFLSGTAFGWEITNALNAHEAINDAAVTYFFNTFKTDSKYNRAPVVETPLFDGVAWHSGSEKSITWQNLGFGRSANFRNWVRIGGVDADVDSVNSETAAGFTLEKPLRHFYDPVKQPTYLTDLGTLANMKITNPCMDHVLWANNSNAHSWNFEQGLRMYKAAMELEDGDALPSWVSWVLNPNGYFIKDGSPRSNLFAASFRALGETLHGIGDMCLPAHVRDDSHGGNYFAGGTDPIESNVGFSGAQKILSGAIVIPAGVTLEEKTVKELMIECALFTNKSFFSTDSICDTRYNITPRTDSGRLYSAPSFSDAGLTVTKISDGIRTDIFQISKNFSNVNGAVVLAEETLTGFVFAESEYHVPGTASEGQGYVLLPLAAAAGAYAINQFFPTMSMEIPEAQQKDGTDNVYVVTAVLAHDYTQDSAYVTSGVGEIRYKGKASILVNGVAVSQFAMSGGEGTTEVTVANGDKIAVEVSAGARTYKSEEKTVSLTHPVSSSRAIRTVLGEPSALAGFGLPNASLAR
ncbi:MAG: hypothetical protein WA705_15200 [Candidatus Ozemobacteraceae bacterium]